MLASKDNRVTQSENGIDALKAPSKKRPAGRPTSSREMAPYEGMSKRRRLRFAENQVTRALHALIELTSQRSLGGQAGAQFSKSEGWRGADVQ
jgi:hypothetical protein